MAKLSDSITASVSDSMMKMYNVHNTDGSEKNGGFKNTSNPPPRPPVTPPPQKPQQPQKK